MSPAARLLLAAVRGYQLLVSPLLPSACRYYPTCSRYAAEAIEHYGAASGAALAARRVLRCHPWGGHGYDPVPEQPKIEERNARNGADGAQRRKPESRFSVFAFRRFWRRKVAATEAEWRRRGAATEAERRRKVPATETEWRREVAVTEPEAGR